MKTESKRTPCLSRCLQIFADELSFALGISAEVAAISLDYFSSGVDVVTKDDGSPVTKADKEVEAVIRKAIAKHFPQDSILGEEEGATPAVSYLPVPVQGKHGRGASKT